MPGVNLRKAEITDGSFILEIRNDPTTINCLHDNRIFDLNNFKFWFKSNKPQWYIITNEKNIDVGYVRTKLLDRHNLQIGADIHPSHRRKGYATKAYKKIFEEFYFVWQFGLEVLSDNLVAIDLYKKLGFIEVERYKLKDGRISIVMAKEMEHKCLQ